MRCSKRKLTVAEHVTVTGALLRRLTRARQAISIADAGVSHEELDVPQPNLSIRLFSFPFWRHVYPPSFKSHLLSLAFPKRMTSEDLKENLATAFLKIMTLSDEIGFPAEKFSYTKISVIFFLTFSR